MLLLWLWESGNPEGISKLAKRASFPQPFRRPLFAWLDAAFSCACGLNRWFASRYIRSSFLSMTFANWNGSRDLWSPFRIDSWVAFPCFDATTRPKGVLGASLTRRSFDPTRTFFISFTEGRYRFSHKRNSWRYRSLMAWTAFCVS